METPSVGFIGAGRVARIILGGWRVAGKASGPVTAYDPNVEAVKALRPLNDQIKEAETPDSAAACDVVFLAVHPPVIQEAASAIKGGLRKDAIVVSLAPKFTIDRLSALLGGFPRVARMIPNAPSLVGQGYNAVAYGSALGSEDKARLEKLIAPLGECPEVEERHLEAYAILSGMGPTYFWPQIYALKTLGESFGLNPDEALNALDAMLAGTVAAAKYSGLSQEQVEDLIPIKPMAEEVSVLTKAFGEKLNLLMQKIRP